LLAVQHGALVQRFARKFRAAVAYYPYCGNLSSIMVAPILILIGEADDMTPAVLCSNLAARPHADGAPIDLVVYPGVRHGFNFPQLQRGATVLGHRLEYDEPAATDAWQRVRSFLATTLADR
jgi:dienelactone hydrolase